MSGWHRHVVAASVERKEKVVAESKSVTQHYWSQVQGWEAEEKYYWVQQNALLLGEEQEM